MARRLGDWVGAVLGSIVAKRVAASADPLDYIPRSRIHPQEALDAAEALEAAARKASPRDAGPWVAAGAAWFQVDDLERAAKCFRSALAVDPLESAAHDGLGTVHKSKADIPGAIAHYRRAIEARPNDRGAFQNLLFALLCSGETSEAEILEAHRQFARTFEAPLATARPATRKPLDPGKRLRIAYVSADLRDHVTGRCVAPILANHDKTKFKTFCYYDRRLDDDFTRSMRILGGTWRDMADLDDAALAARMEADGIDIAVDLSGHTPGNRLLAFARKPAPIQVSYLDYSATTGLESIDYRLTTACLDEPGTADAFYTEKLHRLGGTYWAYNAPEVEDIAPAAAKKSKGLLFSCLNSFYRVSDEALRIWARIVRDVPGSRLAFVGVPGDESTRREILKRLKGLGLPADRLELFGILNYGHYIQLVRATDIALAPFPYNGAMTTLDCLWNGVPVVCLRGGPTFRSTMGRCILELTGLEELVAADAGAYAVAATALAKDETRRRALRESLRERMKQSALCDARALTHEIEAAYREIWRAHCR